MKHFLLFYGVSADYLDRRPQFRAEHLKLAWEAQERGEILVAGALADPPDGAVLMFQGEDKSVANALRKRIPMSPTASSAAGTFANGLPSSEIWRPVQSVQTPPRRLGRAHDRRGPRLPSNRSSCRCRDCSGSPSCPGPQSSHRASSSSDSSCPRVGSTHMASVPWYGIKRKVRTRSERLRKRRAWAWRRCATISGAVSCRNQHGPRARSGATAMATSGG
jgi:uncharacterized protein